MGENFAANVGQMASRTLMMTNELRWCVPTYTTTRPPVLKQGWRVMETGEMVWKEIPLHVENDDHVMPAESSHGA